MPNVNQEVGTPIVGLTPPSFVGFEVLEGSWKPKNLLQHKDHKNARGVIFNTRFWGPGTEVDCQMMQYVANPTTPPFSKGMVLSEAVAFTGTDLAIDDVNNKKVSSVTHTFTIDDIGKQLHVTAGTDFTVGYYNIIGVDTGAALLDRAVGIAGADGGTCSVGGQWLVLKADPTNYGPEGNEFDCTLRRTQDQDLTQTIAFSPQSVFPLT